MRGRREEGQDIALRYPQQFLDKLREESQQRMGKQEESHKGIMEAKR